MRYAIVAMLLLTGCRPITDAAAQRPEPKVERIITVPPPNEPGTTLSGVLPTRANFGTCDAPDLRPITGYVGLRWTYGRSGAGSLVGAVGDSFSFTVPAGVDTVRVWAERGGSPASCVDTVVVAS